MIWVRNDHIPQVPTSSSPLPRSVIAQRTDSEIASSTKRSLIVMGAESVRAGLVFGMAALGGNMAATLAPKILAEGGTPEGIVGVGVGVVAALGVGLGVFHVRRAIAETRSLIARLPMPSFDGDLASRGAKLFVAGAVAAPALLLATIVGGDATSALIAAGFMGVVSAGAGAMATTVASNRVLREERDAALPYRGSSSVI